MVYLEEIGIFQYLLLLWIAILCFVAYTLGKKRKLNLPPGPRGLPIVGNLPFLGKNPHLELCKLGQKYGHLFSIYFGSTHIVVVTNAELAKQLLSKTATADRPPGLFDFIPDGLGFVGENGQEWNEQRRYSLMQMKNLGLGTSDWENLVELEVLDVVDEISKSQREPIDVSNLLTDSVSNNVYTFLTDRRLPIGDPNRIILKQGVESAIKLFNQSGINICFPKLFKFLVYVGLLNMGNDMKNIVKVNKHIRKEMNALRGNKENQSYISKYLTEVEKNESMNLRNSFNERNLIGNVQAFVGAGSDTTYLSVFWLLLAMASFPEVQKKVYDEIDSVLGKDGSADWGDRNKLPYCLATIMEGQRWRTAIPLGVLHSTNEDVVFNGYDIPKGTNLMAPLWAFHHDPMYWDDPDMFQPERFLSSDGKSIKDQEAFLPFSFGKRICPGKNVAYIEIFHYFVSILQKFHVLPESEATLPDLEGIPGLTLHPKRQRLRFVPR